MATLFIDACVRGKLSRTRMLAEEFFRHFSGEVECIHLMDIELPCLSGEYFLEREKLLSMNAKDHPRFNLAHQFARAEYLVIAAPFWDLSFPAILKVYVENVSVEGISFYIDRSGCHGMCKAKKMLYITTRGGYYEHSPLETGVVYMRNMAEFFGIPEFYSLAVEGLDAEGSDVEKLLAEGRGKARELAVKFQTNQHGWTK